MDRPGIAAILASLTALHAATCFIDLKAGAGESRLRCPGSNALNAAAHGSRVALIWPARPRAPHRAGEAQEGIALLEVAVPSSSTTPLVRAKEAAWNSRRTSSGS